MLNKDKLTYQHGELIKAIKSWRRVDIRNGLWDNDVFRLSCMQFWDLAFARGYIDIANEHITLPSNFTVSKNLGYDNKLKDRIQKIDGFAESASAIPLNPTLYNQFFIRYECDNNTRQLSTLPGWIAANAGSTLKVNLTSDITENQWTALLVECENHDVNLEVHTTSHDQTHTTII